VCVGVWDGWGWLVLLLIAKAYISIKVIQYLPSDIYVEVCSVQ